MVMGVPTLVREYSKGFENSLEIIWWLGLPAQNSSEILARLHWEFQWGTAIHEKIRETRWRIEVKNKIFHVFTLFAEY